MDTSAEPYEHAGSTGDKTSGRRKAAAAGLAGVADQAIYSIGNLLFYLVLARQAEGNDFSLVATGMLVYESLQLALRGTFAQPAALLLPSMISQKRIRELAAGQLGYGLMLGLAMTVLVGTTELVFLEGNRLRILLLVSFLYGPLLFQEAVRTISFALRLPGAALASDITWTVIQVVGTVSLLAAGRATTHTLVGLWGVGAAIGAVVGLVRLNLVPRLRFVSDWLAAVESVAGKLTAENVLSALQTHSVSWITLGMIGTSGVGAIRAIRTLFGPVNTLRAGLRQAVLPILRRQVGEDPGAVVRGSIMVAGIIGGVGVLIGLVVFIMPARLGAELLGENFAPAQDLALVYSVFVVGSGALIACQLFMLAHFRVGMVVRARAILTVTTLAAVPVGAFLDGARGAVAAAAVAQLLSLPVWYHYARRSSGPSDDVGIAPTAVPAG